MGSTAFSLGRMRPGILSAGTLKNAVLEQQQPYGVNKPEAQFCWGKGISWELLCQCISSMILHYGMISSGQTRAVTGAIVFEALSSTSPLAEVLAPTTALVRAPFSSSLHVPVILLALLLLWNVGHSLVSHFSLDLADCVLHLHTRFLVSHQSQPLSLVAHIVFMGLPTCTCVPYEQMSYTHRVPWLPSQAFLYLSFFYSHVTSLMDTIFSSFCYFNDSVSPLFTWLPLLLMQRLL